MDTLFAIMFPRQSVAMALAAWAIVFTVVAVALCGCGEDTYVPGAEEAKHAVVFAGEQEDIFWQAQYQACCSCLDDKQVPTEDLQDLQTCLVTGERGGEATSEMAVNQCVNNLTDNKSIQAHPGCIKGQCGDECWFIVDVVRVP